MDEVGHGIRTDHMRHKQRGTSQGSIQSIGNASITSAATSANAVGPAPTTKPPTPPQAARVSTGTLGKGGTLSKGSREYRTPPIVAPPQVPSHYAPNYPMGHPRRERGPGYSTLPMAGHNSNLILPQVVHTYIYRHKYILIIYKILFCFCSPEWFTCRNTCLKVLYHHRHLRVILIIIIVCLVSNFITFIRSLLYNCIL